MRNLRDIKILQFVLFTYNASKNFVCPYPLLFWCWQRLKYSHTTILDIAWVCAQLAITGSIAYTGRLACVVYRNVRYCFISLRSLRYYIDVAAEVGRNTQALTSRATQQSAQSIVFIYEGSRIWLCSCSCLWVPGTKKYWRVYVTLTSLSTSCVYQINTNNGRVHCDFFCFTQILSACLIYFLAQVHGRHCTWRWMATWTACIRHFLVWRFDNGGLVVRVACYSRTR